MTADREYADMARRARKVRNGRNLGERKECTDS
jgi:hypothetical protein